MSNPNLSSEQRSTEWKALPGGILCYGDTGFEIHLNSEAKMSPYTLVDPGGRRFAYWALNVAKSDVVRKQGEREEFTV